MSDPFSSEVLQYFDHPSDAWDSRESKKIIRKEWYRCLSKKNWTLKGGQVDIYFAKKEYQPLVKPSWWLVIEKLQKP